MKISLSFSIFIISIAASLSSLAVQAQNPGFEAIDGKTAWYNFTAPGWSHSNSHTALEAANNWDYASYIRSGQKALLITPATGNKFSEWHATDYTATAPAASGYYVHVIGYVNSSRAGKGQVAMGVRQSAATKWAKEQSIPVQDRFIAVSYSMPAQAGKVYAPAFRVRGNGGVKVAIDDVFIYFSKSDKPDLTAPAAVSDITAAQAGDQVKISFTEGADHAAGTGADGYLILRSRDRAGITTPPVVPQTFYHTSNLKIGPIELIVDAPWENWEVIYNGPGTGGNFTDTYTGSATYLIYMRDKAYNYSAPKRVVVVNGNLMALHPITPDALILGKGTFTVNGGHTVTISETSGIRWMGGTVMNNGHFILADNAEIGGEFRNGNGTLVVSGGKELVVKGKLTNLWGGANVQVQAGGRLHIASGASFTVEQGSLQLDAGAAMLVEGTMDVLPVAGRISIDNRASLAFGDGGALNMHKDMPLPAATWLDGSVCAFYGGYWQSTLPGGLNQDFYNFIWSVPNQGTDLNLKCALNARNLLRVENTNGRKLILGDCASYTVNNLDVLAGTTVAASSREAAKISVNGNLLLQKGTFSIGANTLLLNGQVTAEGGALLGGANTDIVIGNNAAAALTLPAVQVRNLTVNRKKGVELLGDVSVLKNLTVESGVVRTGNYTVHIDPAGELSEKVNGYVLGKVATVHSTPLSNTAYNFSNIGITLTFKGAAAGNTSVIRYTNELMYAGGNPHLIGRAFAITTAVKSGLNATMSIQYLARELNGLNEDELEFFRSTDNGQTLQPRGRTSVNRANKTLVLESIDAFSTWYYGEKSMSSYPVELASFTADNMAGGGTKLAWTTASEKDNEKFEVERSEDGKNWTVIGQVQGIGNSSVKQHYTFTDASFAPVSALQVYYRLKQIDFDGKYEYSKVVSVQPEKQRSAIHSVYFDAAASALEVDYSGLNASATMQIVLMDTNGKLLHNSLHKLSSSAGTLTLPVANLTGGIYIVKAASGDSYFSYKFSR